jgi:hypothetical protein
MRLLPVLLLLSLGAGAQEPPSDALTGRNREELFGAVVAPAVLPSGATSMYAVLGAPELLAGFRQGFGLVEGEARARLDYFRLALSVEAVARLRAFTHGMESSLVVAPTFALGLLANTGATYVEDDNFAGLFVRLMPGTLATLKVSETVHGLLALDVPVDVGLTEAGALRLAVLAGGGAEVYLGEDVSLLVMGQLGPGYQKDPPRPADWDLAYRIQLGLGLRLF